MDPCRISNNLGVFTCIFFHTGRNKCSFQQAASASVAVACPPPGKALTPKRLRSPAKCQGLLTKHMHTQKDNSKEKAAAGSKSSANV